MFLGVGRNRFRMPVVVVMLALSCQIALGAQKAKLAVIDFETRGKIEEEQAGEIVAGLFGTSLSDKYIILERQQIAKVITEQKFQLTDLVSDRNKARRIGKLLGADHIVVGTVSQLGKTVTVEARVVNVATGQWGERGYIYCKGIGEVPKNLPALLSKMKLLGKGGLSTPVPEEVTGPLSAREETFKALIAKGTAALNAGNPAAAKKMAEQAIEIPGYVEDRDAQFLLKRAAAALEHQKAKRAKRFRVYTKWPFSAQEAERRRKETAKALGVPVEKTVDLRGGVKMRFVLIPAGEFMMGSGESADTVARKCGGQHPRGTMYIPKATWFADERPQHRVRITKPFYLGATEVTQEQWERVMGDNPSKHKGKQLPVQRVSWEDCQGLVRGLNALGKDTFALPTEAEWEYACRAGTNTPFHTGETVSSTQANYRALGTYGNGRKGKYRGEATPVGSFGANAFGLRDMHGNVSEWCQDRYSTGYYRSRPRNDPTGPATGKHRVARGSHAFSGPWACRSAGRESWPPSQRWMGFGCRVVLRSFND